MILEGIVTTVGPDGAVNIAPMGPIVEPDMRQLVLRPFRTSTTYQNLKRRGSGMFHVVDDVWLLARAAVGRLDAGEPPATVDCDGDARLADCCRWFRFAVRTLDDSRERCEIEAEVVASGRVRDFFGFNRAKHAVVEAAILSTRLHLLPRDQIVAEMQRLRIWVEKTGGDQERRAFEFLEQYQRQHVVQTSHGLQN